MLSPSKKSSYSRCEQCHSKPATVKCSSCANYMGNGGVVKLCYYCDTRIHSGSQELHQRDILSIKDNSRNANPYTSSFQGNNTRAFLSGEKPSTQSARTEPSEQINYADVIKIIEENENLFLSQFGALIKAIEPQLKPVSQLSDNDDRGKLLIELKKKCEEEANLNIQYKKQMEEIKVSLNSKFRMDMTSNYKA